jgi:hypothetical protein
MAAHAAAFVLFGFHCYAKAEKMAFAMHTARRAGYFGHSGIN